MGRKKKTQTFIGTGLTTEEIKWGKKRFDNYKENYHIEQLSDLQLLEELVYREALQERYKKRIAEVDKKNEESKGKKHSSSHIVNSLNENLEQILLLKDKLGLFEARQNDEGYTALARLKKKFKKWLEENQGSRTFRCPHCSQMIMLKIRTEAWEAMKHPFFKDLILSNKSLWNLYKEGKITKKDVSDVLGVSPDYVDWLEDKIYSKDSDKTSK
jgi:DNA-directed RNA polymerase subunit RPC12/RpoP